MAPASQPSSTRRPPGLVRRAANPFTFIPLRLFVVAFSAGVVAWGGGAQTARAEHAARPASEGAHVSSRPATTGSLPGPTPLPSGAAPTSLPAEMPEPIALRLLRVEPPSDAFIERGRPEMSATFSEDVEPPTIRIAIDGVEVTPDAYVSEHGFVYDPGSDLAAGRHDVTVWGATVQREPFRETWAFSSRGAAAPNYIRGLEPPNGTVVRSGFTIGGFTKPRAHVRVITTTSVTDAKFSEFSRGTIPVSVTANARGYFETRVALAMPNSGIVDVRIASTAPDRSIAVKTLRLRQ